MSEKVGMILDIKHKMVGSLDYTDKKVNLPDKYADVVEGYDLQIVEFLNPEMFCLYFMVDDEDVFCYTINNHKNPRFLMDGFKDALELLEVVNEERKQLCFTLSSTI